MKIVKLAVILSFICFFVAENFSQVPREAIISTDDGVSIYADLIQMDKKRPIIILFHQGGSNAKAEYTEIIAELLTKNYNILAVDQRVGGQVYGQYNRTVAKIAENDYGYCDAYPDLEASLAYAHRMGFRNVIVWGSSYSATLAIQLAYNNPQKVKGVLAFSPAAGGPMEPCKPDPYLAGLKVPLLVLRPSSEMERESSQNQFELAKSHGHQTYIAQNGVHGSSMLVANRVGLDVSDNWQAVWNFLNQN